MKDKYDEPIEPNGPYWTITRREFLKGSSLFVAGLSSGASLAVTSTPLRNPTPCWTRKDCEPIEIRRPRSCSEALMAGPLGCSSSRDQGRTYSS